VLLPDRGGGATLPDGWVCFVTGVVLPPAAPDDVFGDVRDVASVGDVAPVGDVARRREGALGAADGERCGAGCVT